AGRGPRALLACPSGERHTLGLVCFGLVLAERGWRIAYLGADTPVDQILDMSDRLEPAAVVLCVRDVRHVTSNADAIATLAARHHTILAGGGATARLAERAGAKLVEADPVSTAEDLAAHPPAPAGEQGRPAARAG